MTGKLEPESLRSIEATLRAYFQTRREPQAGRVKALRAAWLLYEAHGAPFGPTLIGMTIWLDYGQQTTSN